MDKDWIKIVSEILGKIHYKRKEVELFFLKIGQERYYEDNKNLDKIVAYYNGIYNFANFHLSADETEKALLSILTDLEWNEAVKQIHSLIKQNVISQELKANELAFHKMVAVRNIERVKYFLDNGIDVNCKANLGSLDFTALHSAAQNNRLDLLELLLKYNPDVNNQIQHISAKGCTALHLAIVNRYSDCAKVLLNSGANINCQDFKGQSPLLFAAELNSLECAKLLIDDGADIELTKNCGATPLMMAAQCGSLEVFQFLLQKGANPKATTKLNSNLLHYAGLGGSLEIFKIVYEMNSDINGMNDDAHTPISLAMTKGHTNIIEFCLQIGRNIIIPNYASPKEYAEFLGFTNFLELFSKYKLANEGEIGVKS